MAGRAGAFESSSARRTERCRMANLWRASALSFVLLLPPVVGSRTFADEWTEAVRYQEGCENYRLEHFNRGFVRIRQVDLRAGDSGEEDSGPERIISMWFDGDCIRTDARTDQNSVALQGLTCGETYIRSLDDSTPVTVAHVDENGGKEETIRKLGLTHPRWLGMGANPLEHLGDGRRFRSLYFPDDTQPNEPAPQLAEDEIDGVPATRLEFHSAGTVFGKLSADGEEGEHEYQVRRRIWIAPERGFALLRSEVQTTYPAEEISTLSKVVNSYAETEEDGVWYPRESVRGLYSNGTLVSGARTTVEEISLARPDPAVFTLTGLSLREGRKIADRSRGSRELEFLWDGTQPVPVETTTELADAIVPGKAANRTWLLVANAALLAAIGGYLLFVRHRKQSNS